VLNQQRKVVYGYRRDILEGQEQIYDLVRDLIIGSVQTVFAELVPTRSLDEEQAKSVYIALSRLTALPVELFEKENFVLSNSENLKQDINNFILLKYDLYREQEKVEVVQDAERWLMLETIDQAWKQHMLNLDNLREGIGLRGYGQKNPLTEYKREAFDMFQDMMNQVRMEAVHHIFHLNLEHFNHQELEHRRERELEHLNFAGSDTGEGAVHQVVRAEEKVGRNDPCPCGSGKKYKKCHGLEQ
jgi:preprotein translocase subunit SecA